MKKVLPFLLLLFCIIFLSSCTRRDDIVKLSYTTIDYMGGSSITHIIDFEKNEYSKNYSQPHVKEGTETISVSTFTDEEERIFIEGINKCGLLNINEKYEDPSVLDGGGWNLVVEYSDASTFTSTGSNDAPTKVFNACSTYFYDLCSERVLGTLPKYYVSPPDISYSFHYNTENSNVSTNGLTRTRIGNYKWNKKESLNNDYYNINEELKVNNNFKNNYNYKLVLYTANYDYDERFTNIEVTQYDYNEKMTNKNEIYNGKWFKQIELDIEMNKIYIYKISYKNGDFFEMTFNTFVNMNAN